MNFIKKIGRTAKFAALSLIVLVGVTLTSLVIIGTMTVIEVVSDDTSKAEPEKRCVITTHDMIDYTKKTQCNF